MTNGNSTEPDHDMYLLAQVRESFGRVVYSHKTHEKQADLCFIYHRRLQKILITLTAISSGTFLASLLGIVVSPIWSSVVTSFIALLVTVVSLSTEKFKFEKGAEAHRDTASSLWNIRESYLSLISDLMAGTIPAQDARIRRDQLQEEARMAYAGAPRTGDKAYAKASEGLQKNEEMTFRSDEIDLFLPEALRLNEREA